jgi:hypothetical protein
MLLTNHPLSEREKGEREKGKREKGERERERERGVRDHYHQYPFTIITTLI